MKYSERRNEISKRLETIKEDLWSLMDDLENDNQGCPFDLKVRDSMNTLLDYVDSFEFDSELNIDGN